MPRPRRLRRVSFKPDVTYFKPAGVRMIELAEAILTVEELEAIRLKDLESMDQGKAAKKMKVSQSTFSRILDSVHKKIADALVNGKAIKIEGGVYKMAQPRGMGRGRGGRFGAGQGGRGMMGGSFAGGPGGFCVCPKCKHKVKHTVADPCLRKKCSKCGTKMIRGE